jgi:argonaute-like protein implicated in RNA metabolism and viral defense
MASKLNNNFDEKLMKGLNLAYERMLEFKRYKKSKVVVFRDGKIVEIEP